MKKDRGRSQSRNKNRQTSSSRTRYKQNKPRRNSPANKKKKERRSKNNRTRSEDSQDSATSDTDIDRSETEEDSPEKGEKQKSRSRKSGSHGNRRIVVSHKSRRIGGKSNPTPPLEAQVFKRASDKNPFNERLEIYIADTGCTTSCIPLYVAKTHKLNVKPVDTDEPEMKTYNGLDLNIVGQTHLYLKIKTKKGFMTK